MTRTTGTGMLRRWAALLVTAAVVVVVGTATAATAGDPRPVPGGDGATAVLGNEDSTSDQTGGGRDGGGAAVITIPKAYKEYDYIPACMQNSLENSGDDLCGMATTSCSKRGDILYRVYTLKREADGSVAEGADWEDEGTQCRGPSDPAEGGPVVITAEDIADEARKAAPATTVNVEPTNRSYVNIPNNFYADSAGVDATVELLGETIALRFEPSGFMWTFGDGATGAGAGVKGAAVGAPGSVEHAYRRSGTRSVTLARTFEVTYTVPGGVSGTIPGGVRNTSAPYTLTIGEIQSLVTKVR